MAKKRTARRRTSRKKKVPALTVQLLKIVGGLSLLLLLLVGAGILAYYSLRHDPAAPTSRAGTPGSPAVKRSPADVPQPRTAPSPPAAKVKPPPKEDRTPAPALSREKPVYEVFPKERSSRPLVKLEPLPGQQPPIAAIVVDDIGYDRQMGERFLSLDAPLTYALLPHAPFARTFLAQARSAGHEIMLHLPMEPNEFPEVDPGPGALLSHMSPDRLIAELEANIDQIAGLKGVNNHMGSRLSASPEHMRQIFSVLKRRGLYYIDSRTSADTVAHPSARLFQIPFAQRDIFIDHHDDPRFIRSQIELLIKTAKRQGYVVGIVHPHSNSYEALKEMLPLLKRELQLVPASMVVQAISHASTKSASR